MSDAAISQEEVNSLLGGAAPFALQAPGSDASAKMARRYDPLKQEPLVPGPMHTLDALNERFASHLTSALSELLKKTPKVTVETVRLQKYGAFLEQQSAPINFNVVALAPLKGQGLVVCEPKLIYGFIDLLFGGAKHATEVQKRDYSATEHAIIRRIVDLVSLQYAAAWQPIYPLELQYQEMQTQAQFVSVAGLSETVMTTRVNIRLGDCEAGLAICLPFASIAPISDALFSKLPSDSSTADQDWSEMLSQQLEQAPIEVVVSLIRFEATVGDMLAWKVGRVLACNIEDQLQAHAEGIPLFECSYGTLKGQHAIRIQKFLTHPERSLGAN